jgi:short-subunit dehydrogenase
MNERKLKGKVVVITGASSGFGKGAALAFAENGANVVVAARRGELLEELARECEGFGVKALAVQTDVSRREEVERLAEAATRSLGRIDVWVNDAGVGALGRFERIPLDVHEHVIRTNLLGTLYGSYFAYRQFLRQGAGTLINIASELGGHTVPYYTSYAATKHAVVGLSDSLRQEIGQNNLKGVHVCVVLPAAHDTPFFDHVANYTGHEVQPPRPLHDPQDVVETLVRLARDPEDREIVGGDGVVKILMKHLAPALEEKMAAKYIRKKQFDKAPPAGDTPGAVSAPIPEGTGVAGGRR